MKESHFPPTALFVNLTDEPALYVKPVKSSSFLSVFKLEKNLKKPACASKQDMLELTPLGIYFSVVVAWTIFMGPSVAACLIKISSGNATSPNT